MIEIEELRDRTLCGYNIIIDVVDFCEGSSWLREMFEPVDYHEGGVTVQTPSWLWRGINDYRWWRPTQYTLAELASSYAQQGRPNPSAEAYASAQRELAHYIQASDCAIRVRVYKAGVKLAEAISCSFDLSPENPWDISYWKDYGMEAVGEALAAARQTMTALAA